jgi:pimeloyl-ACP methyl ester carboxylesterase
MANLVHRRSLSLAAAFALLTISLVAVGAASASGAASGRGAASGSGAARASGSTGADCASVWPLKIRHGTSPVLFVHGINSSYTLWTGGYGKVAGTGEPPLTYVQSTLGIDNVSGYTFDWSAGAGPAHTVTWVTDPPSPDVGTRLAGAIHCVAGMAGHQVIVIAHSMGGLVARDAASHDRADIAAVFTLGTPNQGSWLASTAVGQGPNPPLNLLGQAIDGYCSLQLPASGGRKKLAGGIESVCQLVNERDQSGVAAMRLSGGRWDSLPPWPAGLPVFHLAGSIQGAWQPAWPLTISVPFTGAGDGVVSTSSQLAGGTGPVLTCPVNVSRFGVSLFGLLGSSACLHTNEPVSKTLLDDITGIITARHMLPTASIQPPAVPAVFVHNGFMLGSLFRYPRYPVAIPLDNHDYISGLHWAQPSQSGATGTGTLNVNDCTPNCAAGTYVTYRVQLLLSDPRECSLKVYPVHGDVPAAAQAVVFNKIYVKALGGNPPAAMTGYTATLPAACGAGPGPAQPTGRDISITHTGTYRGGQLVYFSIHYSDPHHVARGFGFTGVNGSTWAEEEHPFTSPSYGIVGPHRIDYPFNLGCGTGQEISSSDVKAWIYGTSGTRSQYAVITLTCGAGAAG